MISILGYFFFISYPQVKLEWYDAPLFPLLALVLALSYYSIFEFLIKKVNLKHIDLALKLSCLALILLLIRPMNKVIEQNKFEEANIYVMMFEGAYLRHLSENNFSLDGLQIFKKEEHIEHYDQTLFYIRAFEIENQVSISIEEEMNFKIGDGILCHKTEDHEKLNEKYELKILNEWYAGKIYEVTAIQ